MTWAKFGVEFFDQAADAGLTDAAFRTHSEAIGWLYRLDRDDVTDMTIEPRALRKFATSDDYVPAVAQLLHVGFWKWADDARTHYVLVHHAEVVRQSLMAQRTKRETDRKAQAAKRARAAAARAEVSNDVSDDVGTDVSGDTDRQTSKQPITEGREVTNSSINNQTHQTTPEFGRGDDDWPDVALPGQKAFPWLQEIAQSNQGAQNNHVPTSPKGTT